VDANSDHECKQESHGDAIMHLVCSDKQNDGYLRIFTWVNSEKYMGPRYVFEVPYCPLCGVKSKKIREIS